MGLPTRRNDAEAASTLAFMRVATGLLTVVALLCGATTSGAVTLMVKGDTPSVRYQRWADDMRVPTPDVIVTLLLFEPLDPAMCPGTPGAWGCASATPPKIQLARLFDTYATHDTLYHEIGHQIDYRLMTPASRGKFAAILLPNGSWPQLKEAFADAVMLCALRPFAAWMRYWDEDHSRYDAWLTTGGGGTLLSRSQLTAACRLIRSL